MQRVTPKLSSSREYLPYISPSINGVSCYHFLSSEFTHFCYRFLSLEFTHFSPCVGSLEKYCCLIKSKSVYDLAQVRFFVFLISGRFSTFQVAVFFL